MNLIQKAFLLLYPEKTLDYNTKLVYSGKFKPYNANGRLGPATLTINLSRKWKYVDDDIQIGLIQSLLVKFFKERRKTFNMDLYMNFIKNIHIAVPKTRTDPVLEGSFNRVNQRYFNSTMDLSNLRWGYHSFRKLGSYDYQSDEIMISSIFKHTPVEYLDYVMYHEMLHKKHKFHSTKTGRAYHHTAAFKRDEKAFKDSFHLEKELEKICARAKIKRAFTFF